MSYETTTYPPRTVNRAVGPVQARRGANYIALGAIRPQPWLETYENGRPLYSLSGYEPKDFLQTYTNGRPLESIGAATPKKALVIMALNTAMAKKCAGQSRGGMQRGRMNVNSLPAKRRGRTIRGLGDDGGATIDSSPEASVEDPTIDDSGGLPLSPVYDTAGYTPTGTAEVPTTPIPAMSTIPGVTTPSASTNPLSSLLNSLFAPATSPYGSAYPYVTSGIGTGLGAPIYPGSSISIGGVLLIGGLGILLMSAVGGKKR